MRRDYDDAGREQREGVDLRHDKRLVDEVSLSDRPDLRDAFTRGLDLPREEARERVYLHSRTYELRGSEARTLATVGAFRVVPAVDLREQDPSGSNDVRHLRDLGLVRTVPYVVGKTRTTLVTLTERGRDLVESARRDTAGHSGQTFYAGISKRHDSSVACREAQ